jgi:hypothetical protein
LRITFIKNLSIILLVTFSSISFFKDGDANHDAYVCCGARHVDV